MYIYTHTQPCYPEVHQSTCIDQLHSIHRPDYTMLYNLSSSATSSHVSQQYNKPSLRNTDKSSPVAVKLNPASQLTYHLTP